MAQRLSRGNIVLVLADSGWKYMATHLWTSPPEHDEGDELDDTLWW